MNLTLVPPQPYVRRHDDVHQTHDDEMDHVPRVPPHREPVRYDAYHAGARSPSRPANHGNSIAKPAPCSANVATRAITLVFSSLARYSAGGNQHEHRAGQRDPRRARVRRLDVAEPLHREYAGTRTPVMRATTTFLTPASHSGFMYSTQA